MSSSASKQDGSSAIWPQFSGDTEARSVPSSKQLICLFLFALLVIALRAPDRFLHAQFWAEDGATWYADAYNQAWWAPFLSPVAGYFVTLPRLAADAALLVPFRFAPLMLNLIGAAFTVLPFVFLLSNKASQWGPLPLRAAMAIFYLLMPNSWTTHVTVTNAQWSLALLALLMLLSEPSQTQPRFWLHLLVLFLCGFTGPYCFVLLPIAIFRWRQQRGFVGACVVLAVACGVQGLSLLHRMGIRHTASLGITVERFIRILAGQVYLGTILGLNKASTDMGLVPTAIAAILGTIFVAWCALQTRWPLRVTIFFGAAMLAAGLASPYGLNPAAPAWQSLLLDRGSRYWFFPQIAFGWSLIWMAANERIAPLRAASLVILCLVSIGVIRDFRDPLFGDLHFGEYANRFENAPRGTTVVIPLNPFPDVWQARLKKK